MPGWYHYMSPLWMGPDVKQEPNSWVQTPEGQAVLNSDGGSMPYYEPYGSIMLETDMETRCNCAMPVMQTPCANTCSPCNQYCLTVEVRPRAIDWKGLARLAPAKNPVIRPRQKPNDLKTLSRASDELAAAKDELSPKKALLGHDPRKPL